MRALDSDAILQFPLEGLQLIEAGAGTGKTYTIANLYLRQLLAGRQVGEILVVTFTNAATDELRGRIRARLTQALQIATYLEDEGSGSLLRQVLEIPDDDPRWASLRRDSPDPLPGMDEKWQDPCFGSTLQTLTSDEFLRRLFRRLATSGEAVRDRLTLAVRSMDQAAIHTIHGFCQRALRDFAILSGQPFEAEVGEDDELRQQVIADWWRRTLYPLEREEVDMVLQVLGSFSGLAARLEPLLEPSPKQWVPEPPTQEALDEFRRQLSDSIAELRNQWTRAGAGIAALLRDNDRLSRAKDKGYKREELESSLEELDGYFSGGPTLPLPAACKILTSGYIQKNLKKTGRDDPPEHPFFDSCQEVQQQFDAYCKALRGYLLAAATQAVRSQVADLKRRRQLITYNDLLTGLHDALEGDNGPELAVHLRNRHPVALIDEFQDTDALQYQIFRRLYHQAPGTTLVMIGDPKQAIYSFRGGDIFTYLAARRDVGDDSLWTLDTNWRSTPEVIAAVNQLFSRDDPFVFPQIAYRPATAAVNDRERLLRHGEPVPALTLWVLPTKEVKGVPRAISLEEAEGRTHTAVALEIARLLGEAREGKLSLGDRPVRPGDIAVLVRSSFEAAGLKQALKGCGVNAVALLRERIWDSVEATALLTLLESVAAPEDRSLARQALASRVLELTAEELHQRLTDEQNWIQWVDFLMEVRDRWLRKGFMAAFQHLLRGLDLTATLGRSGEGERRITNLLHLAELLQQASRTHPGIDALIAWFRHQREDGSGEMAQLRLESDENLVRIVTIHASKGLEYPLVFVPYLWHCRPRDRDKNGLLQWHQDGRACVSWDWEPGSPQFLAAEKERLAEDVRLAYVALTRACNALWLVWGGAGGTGGGSGHAGQSALAWLLHPQQTPEHLNDTPPKSFDASSPPALQSLIESFKDLDSRILRIESLPEADERFVLSASESTSELERAKFKGTIASDWRIQSFSTLTASLHQATGVTGTPAPDTPFPFRFPAGPQVGIFLHLLLEKLAFHQSIPDQIRRLAPVHAPRFGLDLGETLDSFILWLEEVVHTPLDASGLTLAALDPDHQLRELSFDFSTAQVDPASLDRVVRQYSRHQDLPALSGSRFRGLVTGVIDLVFEAGGRFYLADYKSILLGRSGRDYVPSRLEAEIASRRYDIQYLFYSVALHRYLRQRLPGYDYERHFGGVFYLFLRGMSVDSGPRQGIWHHCPSFELVRRLDEDLFTPETAP